MAEAAATGKPVAATSRTAAVTFVGLVAALHFIEPQIDPSWRMVSDYEIGRHGYVMVLAVLSSACTLSPKGQERRTAFRRAYPTLPTVEYRGNRRPERGVRDENASRVAG